MSIAAIIGAGDLGGAVAQELASRQRIARVVLVDPAGAAAAGKALDIQQSCAVGGGRARVGAAPELDAAIGADVCVIADRFGTAPTEWKGDEGLAMLRRLLRFLGAAPVLFAGAQQSGLILRAGRELGVPRERLIGSSPEAFRSALRAIVALEASCSPSDVMLAVLGTPPRDLPIPAHGSRGGFVVPWSEASIGGSALERVLSPMQILRIEARAARLWPPGSLTLGTAAARVAEAIVSSSRRTVSALTLLDGEFGARGTIGTLPVALSTSGLAAVRVPELNARERVRLETILGAP